MKQLNIEFSAFISLISALVRKPLRLPYLKNYSVFIRVAGYAIFSYLSRFIVEMTDLESLGEKLVL